MEYITRSAAETEHLGAALAEKLQPGDVIAFLGDLGAGKTAFTRGLARGLGITDPVTSPTYTIVNEYPQGRLPLFHFDMYRLRDAEDLFDLGWEDYLDRGGVCAVEWSEHVADALEDPITVTIRKDPESEDTRYITVAGGKNHADLSL
ncbi:MAG: tRNA (adenosine(37)-N6)-threonylcarbamoyltransferase complex ATPase subunit type 1 TsaE [Oscillospiraceae bacterium]|nr:tRNA (adenosine(37)-N6)-threonylcarbamoyltransferase complex ATPase subunit type 1 TsaE [Oscillospiraceae bacterium]